MTTRRTVRDAILDIARPLLAVDPSTPLDRIAAASGVSRTTVYRHFHNRADLLVALDLEPESDASARILAATVDLLGHEGLRALSMDEVAEGAGVSRATVYRLFPGKTALFAALLDAYAPFADIGALLHRLQGHPPDTVIPELYATLVRSVGPRIAIVRSIMLEVTAGEPEAVEAAQAALRPLYAEVARYFAAQIAAGTVRPIAPLLAAQAVIGPLVIHLLSQSFAGPIAGLEITPDQAAATLAQVALHGLLPDHQE